MVFSLVAFGWKTKSVYCNQYSQNTEYKEFQSQTSVYQWFRAPYATRCLICNLGHEADLQGILNARKPLKKVSRVFF
jgi:hypothetical protein